MCEANGRKDDVFEQTIERLKTGDRRGARTALKQELAAKKKQSEEAQLDAELDRIAKDDEAREAAAAETERAAKAERARQSRLSRAKRQLTSAAAELDTALETAEAKFHEIEACLATIAQSGGRRVHVTSTKWMLIAAFWKNAHHLGARLGLARSPGGPSKYKTISTAVADVTGERA